MIAEHDRQRLAGDPVKLPRQSDTETSSEILIIDTEIADGARPIRQRIAAPPASP